MRGEVEVLPLEDAAPLDGAEPVRPDGTVPSASPAGKNLTL
jgi:hypothetical protein